jgi:hypothetical protein
MTQIKTYEHLTDEELLKEVFLADTITTLEAELARRFEHALDELAKKPKDVQQFVEGRYGNDT